MGFFDFDAMAKLGEKLNSYLEESAKALHSLQSQLAQINDKLDKLMEKETDNENSKR